MEVYWKDQIWCRLCRSHCRNKHRCGFRPH